MGLGHVWSGRVGRRTKWVLGVSGGGRVRSWVCRVMDVLCWDRVVLARARSGRVGSLLPSLSVSISPFSPHYVARRCLPNSTAVKNCCCFCLSVGAGKRFFFFRHFPCKTRFRVFNLRRSQSSSFRISLPIECAGGKKKTMLEIFLTLFDF